MKDSEKRERGISRKDAERLIMEAIERMGEYAEVKGHIELINKVRRVIELGVEGLKQESQTVSFSEGAWASVEARQGRRATTCRDLRHFVRRMLRVKGVANRPMRAMNTRECRELLKEAFGRSVHSYRKGRAILHSIFNYARRQEWCDGNPVSRIEVPAVQETQIAPLTPEEAEKLIQTVNEPEHKDMRFSVYLMLFCGVRPTEVTRISEMRDILWKQKQLIIRSYASKTGGGRVVPLRNMAQLPRTACYIPKNWLQRWKKLRRAAGFKHWNRDCLRHTFATYHALYYKNIAQLQLEMGHRDSNLLRTRYVLAVDEFEAKRFWRLKI